MTDGAHGLDRTGPAAGGHERSAGGRSGDSAAPATGRSDRSGGFSESTTAPPGRLSATAAALVAAVAVLSIGVAGDFRLAAGLSVLGAVGFAAGVTRLATDDPWRVAAGMLLAVVSSGVLVVAAALGPTPTVWGLWIAVFGAAILRLRSADGGRLADAVGVLSYGLVPVWSAAFIAVLLSPLALFSRVVVEATGAVTGTSGLPTLSLLLALATLSARAALGVLPVARLTAPDDRERFRDRVGIVERALWRLGVLAALSVPAAMVFEVTALATDPALSSSVAVVAGSEPLRATLLAVAGVACVTATSAVVVRWAGGSVLERTRRGVAAGVGACLAAGAALAHGPVLDLLSWAAPPAVARLVSGLRRSPGGAATTLLVVSIALILVVATLFLLLVVTDLGLVPARTAEPAVAAAALLAAVALSAGSLPAAVVVGGVTAAMVVWDLGEYAVGIGERVPGGAPRVESVHAAGSVGAGVAVTALVAGAHGLVARVEPTGTAAAVALAAALVGGLALAAALRR